MIGVAVTDATVGVASVALAAISRMLCLHQPHEMPDIS
jgi:hypothetical protein